MISDVYGLPLPLIARFGHTGRDIFLVRGVIAIPKMFRRCKKLKLEVFTQFQLTSLLIKDSPGKKMVAG